MKRILLPYIIGYILLSIGLLYLYFSYSQVDLHLLLNSWHTKAGDIFFSYSTHLAEWPLYIIGLLPLLFKRYIWTIVYAISEVVGGLLIVILKQIFELPRPANVFSHFPELHLPTVEGVRLHWCDSFPSGHASTFFVFCTVCALIISVRCYKRGLMERQHSLLFRTMIITGVMLLLVAAVLGAYSRVYLSQHFFIDVYVGSFIGILVPCIVVVLLRKKLLY